LKIWFNTNHHLKAIDCGGYICSVDLLHVMRRNTRNYIEIC